jgi:hypothetical protein
MRESEIFLKELCEKMNGQCLLGFSRGKDSLLSWLQLKKIGFTKIVPYYLKMIPDELSFETESLAHYENVFETKIIRLISPSFSRMMNDRVLQAPINNAKLDAYGDFVRIDYQDVQRYVKRINGLPDEAYTALGVTMFDSFIRRNSILKNGPINHKKQEFYAIHDWKKTEIFAELERNNILLPKDYLLWGKTFDGLDYRFTGELKKQFPEDYELLKLYFPLLDVEQIRYEQV